MREVDLAAKVVDWLTAEEWDVYQEVVCSGGVADIVAVRAGLVWIIECKMSLTLGLLDQVKTRIRDAHLVSVAIPYARRPNIGYELLDVMGVGALVVRNAVRQRHPAKLNRSAHSAAVRLRETLCPEHKTEAQAGAKGGGYWSPWRATCQAAREYVDRHGEVAVAKLMREIKHHYGSDSAARSSIVQWLRAGSIKGLRIVEGRPLKVAADDIGVNR